MDFVETEGDTIDQAIENALKALGVAREKITVDILSEGKKGIFGFGAQKARVRASLTKSGIDRSIRPPALAGGSRAGFRPTNDLEGATGLPEGLHPEEPQAISGEIESPVSDAEASAIAEKAKATLVDILGLMGIKATVETLSDKKSGETILEVRSDNSGLLIGRKGQTLEALHYLVTRIAGERPGNEGPHLVIDIENYRERRRKSLEDMALRLGEKAKRQRKTVTVDALSAADRRIIHAALQDDPWVTTRSLGQGSYRRLLIIPEGDRKRKDEPTAAAEKSPAKETSDE
ncbi:MAG: RNA-binding cell elongation regulator Jag/EloR [Deltaproteobacteria bacterium]|nr:RNA-binding cell elongation regulator Jag/EloR [Deltaproteobacteria bacterium]